MRGARAVVFATLFEGFGIPVLEAMHAETPVVASRGGSAEEVAGGAAVLVDPEDAASIAAGIRAAVEDGQLRADLIQRGRVRRERLPECGVFLRRFGGGAAQAFDEVIREAREEIVCLLEEGDVLLPAPSKRRRTRSHSATD
jgi:glycosyltransferase involved in cell wall biosynthesis